MTIYRVTHCHNVVPRMKPHFWVGPVILPGGKDRQSEKEDVCYSCHSCAYLPHLNPLSPSRNQNGQLCGSSTGLQLAACTFQHKQHTHPPPSHLEPGLGPVGDQEVETARWA